MIILLMVSLSQMTKCTHCNKRIWFWQFDHYLVIRTAGVDGAETHSIGLIHWKCLESACQRFWAGQYKYSIADPNWKFKILHKTETI